MFRALIHRKLSRQQANMEDLVTSLVFGTLEHCASSWLAAFLRRARLADGTQPLRTLPEPTAITWDFWPWVQAPGCIGCEPDVALVLHHTDGQRTELFLEVKFLSGKSSHDDLLVPSQNGERLAATDQLAREWQNLHRRSPGGGAWLLYVTSGIVMPASDIDEAQQELLRKGEAAGQIAWLSLRELHPLLREQREGWLAALRVALERLELMPFEGITPPRPRGRQRWSFTRFAFRRRAPALSWSFGGFRWPPRSAALTWRFSA